MLNNVSARKKIYSTFFLSSEALQYRNNLLFIIVTLLEPKTKLDDDSFTDDIRSNDIDPLIFEVTQDRCILFINFVVLLFGASDRSNLAASPSNAKLSFLIRLFFHRDPHM